jgi:hypothetical protein
VSQPDRDGLILPVVLPAPAARSAGPAPEPARENDLGVPSPRPGESPHPDGPEADGPEADGPEADGPEADGPAAARRKWPRLAAEVAILAAFLAAGIAVTWPRAAYLAGRIPLSSDQSQYVWSMWWVARQVVHLGDPWSTSYLAAPVGVRMGFDTLMPLPGALLAPVTLAFGPSVSYNLLTIATPGLAGYAAYLVARTWLPNRLGSIAAGAFFGLSGMIAAQDWNHLHTAVGAIFLPLTLAAAVRLRRAPALRRGLLLGVVLGASALVDQESAVLALFIAAAVLVPWLVRGPGAAGSRALLAAAAAAVVIASPQLVAMAQQLAGSGGTGAGHPPASDYLSYSANLQGLFGPSPRLARYGIESLAAARSGQTPDAAVATFGLVLTILALTGLIVAWRRRGSRRLAVGWLGFALLSLGPTLAVGSRDYIPLAHAWDGIRVSLLMPYTWLIRVPEMTLFREADRLALPGLVAAALLAGAAVEWLRAHAWPLVLAAVVLGAVEAGWPGNAGQVTAPTSLPALDRPIAADHSGSVVVDAPFAVRGPQRFGAHLSQYALVLATADGHPRAVSYTSGVPKQTVAGISSHAFYAGLVTAAEGRAITSAKLAAARQDLRTLHVGWVLVWTKKWTLIGATPAERRRLHYPDILRYVTKVGFRLDYRADGVLVYRPRR